MLTNRLRDTFIRCLKTEREAAENEPTQVTFIPKSQENSPYRIYHGQIDTDLRVPDGTPVRIKHAGKQNHRLASGEIIGLEDFTLSLATNAVLDLSRGYTLEIDMTWLIERLIEWYEGSSGSLGQSHLAGRLLEKEQSRHEPVPSLAQQENTWRTTGNLNDDQHRALQESERNPISFIWGPPGTGKSHTLSHLITRRAIESSSVLLVATSNVAVDAVMSKLLENQKLKGLIDQGSIVRSGHPQREPMSQWEPVHPLNIALQHYPTLRSRLDDLKTLRKERLRLVKHSKSATVESKLIEIHREIQRINNEFKKHIKLIEETATVIGTTFAKLIVSQSLHERRYDLVIVDEASMASIPSVIAAASLAKASTVIVGDFRQLPPIVLSDNASVKRWLGRCIFEEAGIVNHVESGTMDPRTTVLRTQYRMNPEIAAVIDTHVYGGKLRNGSNVNKLSLPARASEYILPTRPCILVDTSTLDTQCVNERLGRHSRINVEQAKLTARLALSASRLPDIKVGVITPYRAQTKAISSEVARQNPTNSRQIAVSTVHRFQGSERDIVSFDIADGFPMKAPSVLISGSRESIALRLMNVALSRAQKQVVVIADLRYLFSRLSPTNTTYRILSYFEQNAVVVDASTLRVVSEGRRLSFAFEGATARSESPQPRPSNDMQQMPSQHCPSCGAQLSVRVSSRRQSLYIGCSSFPGCRYTERLTDSILLAMLVGHDLRCPTCNEHLAGEMERGKPKLVCVRCSNRLPSFEAARLLTSL